MNWVYLASSAQGDEADTVALALREHVISRPAFNSNRALIPNVGRLTPGDHIVLAYRRPTLAARVVATVVEPVAPVRGTTAIDEIRNATLVADFRALGFRLATDAEGHAVAHVIHLTNVRGCDIDLRGDYGGQTTLRLLDEVDAGVLDEGHSPQGQHVPVPDPVGISVDPRPVTSADTGLTREQARFDAYIMVDWSGRATPIGGKDSVWIAEGIWGERGALEIESCNPRTRQKAVDRIVQWCSEHTGRVLVGFDFAFGYPSGFAEATGLLQEDEQPWQAIHRYFGEHVKDDDSNRHNLYDTASSLNRCVSAHGAGPFWGCRQGEETNHLKPRRIGSFVFPYEGLSEWRRTEARARARATVQSVWKLYGGVSVGGQTIVGIHRLQQLRERFSGRARLWPFETGWHLPGQSNTVVLAEIFPSVVPIEKEAGGTVKDDRQVRSSVWFAANRDRRGLLAGDLGKPAGLDQAALASLMSEEGWILFCDAGPR